MALTNSFSPILVELDPERWNQFLDRCESWFYNVAAVQSSFRKLAEDTRQKVNEPHIQLFLDEVIETAKRHEQSAAELFRLIDRKPATHKLAGSVMAKIRELTADMVGTTGGAASGWRDMHQLFLSSQNAISAFAAAEQLGYALGLNEITDLTFTVVNEKTTQHLLLQELLLEMAAVAILYEMKP